MKKIAIISVILLILSSYIYVNAADFSYSARIENGGNKRYKAVRLTSDIYNSISENMSDLVIYDEQKEQVPYFINSYIAAQTEVKKSYQLNLTNSFVKDNYYYFDYTLKIPQSGDVIATSVDVDTNYSGFAKKVELFGGYDNINWEEVQNDILYNVDGNKKLSITFDGIKKYTHYRFKIYNSDEKVEFNKVSLNYDNLVHEKEYFVDRLLPKYTVEDKGDVTIVRLKGLKNLKLNSLTIQTDSYFKRNITFNGALSEMLYNLEFKAMKYQDLTMELNFYRSQSDEATVEIENRDDKPIKISGIELQYFVDDLVFENLNTQNYTLMYGNSEIKTPKSYDITNYKEQILSEGYDLLKIKEIKKVAEKGTTVTADIDYKLIFNVTILLVALIMGVVILRKLRKQ